MVSVAENEMELLDYDKGALGCAGVIASPVSERLRKAWIGFQTTILH